MEKSCCHHHKSGNSNKNLVAVAGAIYTCPMHPEIKQNTFGFCPICGMDLEPDSVFATPEHDLKDTWQKFYLALILSLPILIANMGANLFDIVLFKQLTQNHLFNYLQLILATPVIFWSAYPIFTRFASSLKSFNLNMFTLIGLGVGVAYLYSAIITLFPKAAIFFGITNNIQVYFEAATIIVTLVTLGQIIELKARSKANNALKMLIDLAPKTAYLINKDDEEIEVNVDQLKIGDTVRIKPGGIVPADGKIIKGYSLIDQSSITGEAIFAAKQVGDNVFASTINQSGSFVMQVEKVGTETTLSRIIELVNKAQRSPAKIQKLVDKVSGYFVPLVILIAIISGGIWYLLGSVPGHALLITITVLIIACPCALGLATPMSIMVATGRGAKSGILIKNAEALEVLDKIDTVILDKTGTLTYGKPQVIAITSYTSMDNNTLLSLCASLEQHSEHHLAKALVKHAEESKIPLKPVTEFTSITGYGITGLIDNHAIAIGNQKFMAKIKVNLDKAQDAINNHLQQGHTVLFLALNNILTGIIALADTVKPYAKETIKFLNDNAIDVVMLTGDNELAAQNIANSIGIKNYIAEVLPENKHQYVEDLQKQGKCVAMVGDGINDSPALAKANVGIAMGNSVDIAMESASVILISGQLKDIIELKQLSHQMVKNIKQNLFFAFGYNLIALTIATGIFYPIFKWVVNPMFASFTMTASSICVILNSLRLAKTKSHKN